MERVDRELVGVCWSGKRRIEGRYATDHRLRLRDHREPFFGFMTDRIVASADHRGTLALARTLKFLHLDRMRSSLLLCREHEKRRPTWTFKALPFKRFTTVWSLFETTLSGKARGTILCKSFARLPRARRYPFKWELSSVSSRSCSFTTTR